MDIYQTLQKELNNKVVKNELLSNHTTFKIGGPARYFFVAKTKEDAVKAIKAAKELNLPFFVLGNGSNLLVSDEGFDGLAVKIHNTQYTIHNSQVTADAGLELTKLVNQIAEAGLAGLEFASGIPGTVGAAVYGNVGAFESSISDVLVSAEILNKNGQIKKVDNRWLEFGYRDSRLKKSKEIVLGAEFQLKPASEEEIKNLINKHLAVRREKHPLDLPNAGSIFKNVEVDKELKAPEALKKAAKNGKVAAGYLIEQCELKGTQIGGAKISEKHANFIVNIGGAKASDVIKLINLTKKKVYDKLRVELKEEIQLIGF